MNDFKYIVDIYIDKKNILNYTKTCKKIPPQLTFVNGLPIHFNRQSKRIGITFSGGADSTLLLFILANLIKTNNMDCKIYPLTNIRFHETKPWLEYISTDVLKYLQSMFPGIIEDQYWFYIPTTFEEIKISALNNEKYNSIFDSNNATCDALLTSEYSLYFIKKNNLDWMYNGTTTNPPIDIDKSPKFRNYNIRKLNYTQVLMGKNISPFFFINKDWIMAQYKNFGLEELLSLTRSCQSGILDFNLKKWNRGDPYPPECGKCFFCIEKKWGQDNMQKYLKV